MGSLTRLLVCSAFYLLTGSAKALLSNGGPKRRKFGPGKPSFTTRNDVFLQQTTRGGSDDDNTFSLFDRRHFFTTSSAAFLGVVTQQQSASARGLVQFPCDKPLFNEYHLMRAGTSLLEEQGIWSTNPLFLTNREDALADSGQEQVLVASKLLATPSARPTVVKYSLAASCMDTANTLGRELQMGRDRLVPEFTFLDPRAIGKWDNSNRQEIEPAIWALDNDQAGPYGLGGRPPANQDGTPHETLADQAVRLRQVMSVLESQYGGDTILLIFPDGTGPALLSAMIAGIPYNRVHELEFAPGEVRLNVTQDSTLALWQEKQRDLSTYRQQVLVRGRENLRALESQTDSFVSLKDQKMEEERLAVEKDFAEKEEKRLAAERANEAERERAKAVAAAAREEKSITGKDTSGVVLAVAGMALVGGAGILLGGEEETPETKSTPSYSNNNNTGMVLVNGTTATDTAAGLVLGDVSGDAGGLVSTATSNRRNQTEYRSRSSSLSSPESVTSSSSTRTTIDTPTRTTQINGDLYGSMPVSQEDRMTAAQRVMDDYLDQDDGGEAWLTTLAELAAEQDDNDNDADDDDKDVV